MNRFLKTGFTAGMALTLLVPFASAEPQPGGPGQPRNAPGHEMQRPQQDHAQAQRGPGGSGGPGHTGGPGGPGRQGGFGGPGRQESFSGPGHQGGPGGPGHQESFGGPGRHGGQWRAGQRFNGSRRVVNDWRGHHLRQPPRGYQWVQDGSQFVLIAAATGIISSVILNSAMR